MSCDRSAMMTPKVTRDLCQSKDRNRFCASLPSDFILLVTIVTTDLSICIIIDPTPLTLPVSILSRKIRQNEGERYTVRGIVQGGFVVTSRHSAHQVQHTFYSIQATYHDRFNAGVALRSKFDDERNT